MKKEEPCDNCNNDVCCCIVKEEPKQETLEEVAERLYPIFMELGNCTIEHDSNEELREAFIDGAKWQQQQNKNLYSEEDMWEAYKASNTIFEDEVALKQEFKEWFEQFKKK